MRNKRVLLSASHSQIEPLGLLHLSSIAKQEGWKSEIILADNKFEKLEALFNK